MLWIIVGSVAVVMAGVCSIAASWHSHRDIAGGHPTIDSVADVTGIWSPTKLDRLLGPRDAEDRYTATPEEVLAIPTSRWKRLFDNDLVDLACVLCAVASPFLFRSQRALSIGLLSLVGAYLLIGYIVAFVVVTQFGSQDEPGQRND